MNKDVENSQTDIIEEENVSENTQSENTDAKAEEKAAKESATKTKPSSKKGAKQGNVNSAAALSAAQAECEKLKTQLEEVNNTMLRTAAEYDNFRKRSAREKDTSFSSGISHAVEKLLPVVDTLTLAINAETEDVSYKKGVEMTLEQCKRAFEALGVQEIEAINSQFDPNLHAAVAQQPAPEGTESGTVMHVLQTGYTLNGKVIRHASVMVAE